MNEDIDKIVFDDRWEFVTETDIPAKVVTKLIVSQIMIQSPLKKPMTNL